MYWDLRNTDVRICHYAPFALFALNKTMPQCRNNVAFNLSVPIFGEQKKYNM